MSKTYMRKEKGDTAIVQIALSDWAGYRRKGFVFVEADEDGVTPQQQFLNQTVAAAEAKGDDPVAEVPTMANKKPEIQAWLDEHGIEYETDANKDSLIALVEAA